jgi:hyperosmotically inducible protein
MRRSNFSSMRVAVLTRLSLALISGTVCSTFAANTAINQAARNLAGSDSYITKEVHHELVMLPFFSVFDNLEYRVEGSKVTLMGQVVDSALKDDAVSAVKDIEGVETVDNQIEVLPASSMDDQIRRAEYRAIYSNPALQMYSVRSVAPIHIIVSNGHVTLEGAVATQADKDTANIMANQVPNVFSVTNNLSVDNSK